MATTLVNQLPAVAFSKNRITVTLQTDSVFASVGVAAVNDFALTGPIFTNREIIIKYGAITLNFRTMSPLLPITGANLPSGSGNFAHAQAMVAYFQSNANLNRDFTITASNTGGPRVVFTAKTTGTGFNFVPAIYTSVTLLNVTAGAAAERKKNMALSVDCQVKIGGVFTSVYSEIIPFRNTQVKLNIAEILHAELSPDFPSSWSTTTPWKHTNSLREYRIVATEGYGDPFALQGVTTLPTVRVKMGGTGVRQGLTKTPAQWVQGASAASDKFLRYGIATRSLQTDEPTWLTFLNTRANISLGLYAKITIVYADNTSAVVYRLLADTLLANECITIPAWPTALTLQNEAPTKAIAYYLIRMFSNGANLSEEVQFHIDAAYREHKQYFIFLNSVGAWDSFLAYGKSAYGAEWTNQQIQRPLPEDYTSNDGDLSDVGSTMRDTFAVATSFYSAEQLRFLRDFFNSPYKFRWIDGTCYPISMKAKELPEGSDGQNQYGHTFEYVFAHQNESYE
jgi:hypothetical protein